MQYHYGIHNIFFFALFSSETEINKGIVGGLCQSQENQEKQAAAGKTPEKKGIEFFPDKAVKFLRQKSTEQDPRNE